METRDAIAALQITASDIVTKSECLSSALAPDHLDEKSSRNTSQIESAARSLQLFLSTAEQAQNNPAELRHEIRNHLNHISGPAQLLRLRLGTEALADLSEIERLIEVCASLVDDCSSARPVPSSAARPVPIGARARILVAEDEEANRKFLSEVLTNEGHSVELASDGVVALEKAQSTDFDLLLLDLGLPLVSGFDVLERLQLNGWRTPIIVVTGRRAVGDAVRCIERGADDFLTKPIQIEILRARVNSSVEKMRLREREFAQFFPPKMARMFARRPNLIDDLPSRDAQVSVLFCDIRRFTAISERLGPDKTLRWLRGVMHELSELIIENDGVLVDFAGDEVMAMWGAPDPTDDHATRACNTAVQILERIPSLSDTWRSEIGDETDLAIGVNSGSAMVGHIGTARKTKYGPLGDAVNIGSRVLDATTHMQCRLLVSGATRALVDESWASGEFRRLCHVRMKNLAKSIELYEVQPVALQSPASDLHGRYEEALMYYEEKALQKSSAVLGQLLVDFPEDGPSLVLMSRVVNSMLNPQETFDPVWDLRRK